MASTASPAPTAASKSGVAPLRAGKGTSFLLRRLHSLSGIIPIGLFLIEHFVSNAFATNGPEAYTQQVKLLSSFPFVVGSSCSASGCRFCITRSMASTSGTAARPTSPTIPGPATGCTPRSAGPAASPSPISSGTPGICASAVFICSPIRMRLSAKCRQSFSIPGRLRFTRWEFSAPRGTSLLGLGFFFPRWGVLPGHNGARSCVCLGPFWGLVFLGGCGRHHVFLLDHSAAAVAAERGGILRHARACPLDRNRS